MNFERNKKELIKFDRKHCKKLLDTEKIKEAKEYLKYFFFPHQNKIFFFNGYEFVLYNREDALKLIPDDFKISIVIANEHTKKFEKEDISLKAYLKSTEFMDIEYKPTINFKDEKLITSEEKRIRGFTFTEQHLNMAKPFNHDVITGKPIEQTKQLKRHLKKIYTHISKILCSGDENAFEYVLNYIACTFAGRKLRKCLLLQSKERTGKGIIINDIFKRILGERMHKTNSVESILKYSKAFEGCCFLNFDELPHCDNYKGLQDMLKALITEPYFNCRDMYTTGYQQKNTFNILITTNNDGISLTQNNNTKYVCLDVSEEKIGNHEYFKELYDAINSKDVLEQFYNEMMERFKTLDNWNEDYMPTTQTGKMKIIEALPRLYKDIKETYILTGTDLNIRTEDFFSEYVIRTKDRTSKNKLGRMLKDIGITPNKNNKNDGYNYKKTSKELYEVFIKKNWIDELVDVIDGEEIEEIKTEAKKEKKKKKIETETVINKIDTSKEEEKEIIKELENIEDIDENWEDEIEEWNGEEINIREEKKKQKKKDKEKIITEINKVAKPSKQEQGQEKIITEINKVAKPSKQEQEQEKIITEINKVVKPSKQKQKEKHIIIKETTIKSLDDLEDILDDFI